MVDRSDTWQPSPPRWRYATVLVVLAAMAAVLLGRAVTLQLADRDFLRDEADARHLRTVTMPAHRGTITDRHGKPLAVSSPVASLWAVPRKLLDDPAGLAAVAEVLELDPAAVRERLEARRDREFVYLRRHVPPAQAAEALAREAAGVAAQREYRRFYPAGEVSAHLLGLTDIDDRGQAGLERTFDSWMSGAPGAKRVLQDRHGRVVEDVELLREPRPGRDLALAVDRRLQYLAYRELKAAVAEHEAAGGAAVLLDVVTGEVLAKVNQPSFNPHRRAGIPEGAHRNRAVTDAYEPGSLIKPFTVAAALSAGAIERGQRLDTSPGTLAVSGHTVRDLRDYGELDAAGVVQKSSNVGAAQMALEMPPEALWGLLGRLGFGAATGSGIHGETHGRMPGAPPRRPVERATLGFGYGLSATPLQMARAYAAIAAGGVLREPTFVRAEGGAAEGEQVLPVALAGELREMLEGVVSAEGTGRRAAVPGYRVAGKTGTVRKVGPNGYDDDRYVAMFAGFAPASAPRLALVVVIDEPRGAFYGGEVAAPPFSRIMGGALRLRNLPPDDLPRRGPVLAGRDGEG